MFSTKLLCDIGQVTALLWGLDSMLSGLSCGLGVGTAWAPPPRPVNCYYTPPLASRSDHRHPASDIGCMTQGQACDPVARDLPRDSPFRTRDKQPTSGGPAVRRDSGAMAALFS